MDGPHQRKMDNTIEILDEELTIDSDNTKSQQQKQQNDMPAENRRQSLTSSIMSNSREYHLRPEPAGQEPGELGHYRRKLMHLLEESDHYSTETLSTYLLHDGLFDERAIVMGKIGNHQEALIIYVHILQVSCVHVMQGK